MGIADDQDFLNKIREEYLQEALFQLEQCEESYLKLDDPALRAEELGKIFRLAHSLKGAGALAGFPDLADFAHALEDCLAVLRTHPDWLTAELTTLLLKSGDEIKQRVIALENGTAEVWQIDEFKAVVRRHATNLSERAKEPTALVQNAAEFINSMGETGSEAVKEPSKEVRADSGGVIRVNAERIESVSNIVGELVVLNSQLMTKASQYPSDSELSSIVSLLDKTIRELQDKTLSMRMTPLKTLFQKAQRSVRDLSLHLGKSVEFRMSGEDTEIDRTMVDMLGDPLLHLVRNSIDHGIEDGERRRAANKADRGTIHISSWQAGGRVFISLEDDGAGINHEKVLNKAISSGVLKAESATLSEAEIEQLIFSPGFSTAEKVTDISGRGVGLDVVKTNIEKLKGVITVRSQKGQGTCFTIALPLTTAIMHGMLIACEHLHFVIPMEQIRGLSEYSDSQLTRLSDGRRLLRLGEKMIPLFSLKGYMGLSESAGSERHDHRQQRTAVLLRGTFGEFALEVGEALGQIQVVLKSLSDRFAHVSGVTGAAILGNGRVVLVLDVDGLQSFYSRGVEPASIVDLRRAQ